MQKLAAVLAMVCAGFLSKRRSLDNKIFSDDSHGLKISSINSERVRCDRGC